MNARFPRQELIRRVEALAQRKHDIAISNMDAEQFLLELPAQLITPRFVYCDPPYVKKSDRLYFNFYTFEDHRRISETIRSILGENWVVSYDYSEYIESLYLGQMSLVYSLQYHALRAYLGREIFIFANNLNLPKTSVIKSIQAAINVKGISAEHLDQPDNFAPKLKVI